jgi:hypothetical protein
VPRWPFGLAFILRKHPARCNNIGRDIGYSEEDDNLAARLALENATVFLHWLLADRARGCHRNHGRAAN